MTGERGTARGAAAALTSSVALWRALTAVLALFLVVSFIVQAGGDAASGPVTTVDVTLTEFAISPEQITVPAGQPVVLRVRNAGGIAHDLAIAGVVATPMLEPGESDSLSLAPLEPGDYAVICTVAGHADGGMRATLRVVDGAVGGTGHDQGALDGHGMTPVEMAAKHEQLVRDFPVPTEGVGNQLLEPLVDAEGVKVFELTAGEMAWEVAPGDVRQAMAYNGQVPGPRLEVDLGDRVRIVLHNALPDPTAIHLHGLLLPNDMDGVPGLTQSSVMPGESFIYEFEVRNSGSHMYHSHFDAARQVPMGLLGAFIVHDPDDEPVDLDYTMILNDGPLGYTINGKGFPATEPLVVSRGDRIRVRYMNEGLQLHPMHLHGMPQTVVARDGYPLPAPYLVDVVTVAPGERIDVVIDATELGAWALHCHILTHAERAEGMFGMVTALVVTA